MSLSHEPAHDDRQLERYLLGLLPDEDAERLDELSVADDEIAWRLRAVENDLVDAYVTGTLEEETRARFEVVYLASPRRRERVKLAQTFLRAIEEPETVRVADTRDATTRAVAAPASTARSPLDTARGGAVDDARGGALDQARGRPMWGLLAAAALVILAVGTLVVQDLRVRAARAELQRQTAALELRQRDLERQLEGQRAANAQATGELERLRAAAATGQRSTSDPSGITLPTLAALILLPQTRSAGPVATLTVPEGAAQATFGLRLETNDFPRYQVALKDPATNQVLWRSTSLAAASAGGTATVSVVVPAALLKAQHYALELSGQRPAGSEIIGSYAVEIARR